MTPTERADRLAEIDRQLYGEMPGRDSLWSGWSGDARFLRNELTASDSRSKEMVGLLREAADAVESRSLTQYLNEDFLGDEPFLRCGICQTPSHDELGPQHTDTCFVTRLRAAADMAEVES